MNPTQQPETAEQMNPAAVTENPAESTVQPAKTPADQSAAASAAQPAGKPAKAAKDPSAPKLVPFQMVSYRNRQRLAALGKADDKLLGELLDAAEFRRDSADLADSNTGKMLSQIRQLKQKISAQEQMITALKEQIETAPDNESDNSAAEKLQLKEVEIAAQNQKIADQKQKITDISAELESVKQQLEQEKQNNSSATASIAASNEANQQIAELQQQLQESRNKAAKAEDESKDYLKQIEQLQGIKKELEKQLKTAQKKAATPTIPADALPEQYLNHYSDADILHHFPTITAKMLELTAEKLTACRKDGHIVTPAMILGDMFNRYTIERWNLWFYSWVLEDKDIISIAQEVEPKIDSIRKLKAALKIA